MRMQIGEFLIRRLHEVGVKHLFGLPGDFNLSFLEQVEASETLTFVGNCNELNAAYAADGYARTAGIGAVLTTFGVGDMGAIGGIAGAYAENVPVIHITGAPPLHAIQSRALLHHTLADGGYGNIGRCMAEFTVAQARITPANAVTEIDRVLTACWQERRPVHLQLPSDITHLTVETPTAPLRLRDPDSDPVQLATAIERVCEALQQAQQPAMLVDAEVGRFGVAELAQAIAERLHMPYAILPPAKGMLDETQAGFLGTYVGAASPAAVRQPIEHADCLLGIGLRFTDSSTSLFSQQIAPARCIALRRHDLTLFEQPMPGVTLRDLLAGVLAALPPSRQPRQRRTLSQHLPDSTATEPLTHASLWPRIRDFLRAGDVVLGEAGTANAALGGMPLPTGASYIAQPIWGAIGYTLPALLGAQLGAPSRRHLLFIGDGSVQLTVQELSTLLRQGLKPIIFLINNQGYTIERLILGERSAYNDIADWNYAGLPQVFAPQGQALSLVAGNVAELTQALQRAQAEQADRLVFIELRLPMMDAPPSLPGFANLFADFDYGERGPRNPSSRPAAARQAEVVSR